MSHPLIQEHWDVIVVGAGLGGGTVGRALAEVGKKVLFVEFGSDGHRMETNGLSETPLPAARLARGLWPYPMEVQVDGQTSQVFAPIGAGVGGSSVFYAATLERPEPHDLEASPTMPHPTGGWPVSFQDMQSWYDRAARQFQVYGTADPLSDHAPVELRDAPDFNEAERALEEAFEKAGLHPYHAHTAMAQGAAHDDCLGRRCAKDNCKMDGRSAGVEPALATGRAFLLSDARVSKLLGDAQAISGVEIRHGGETHILRADQYVLAAGALGSPRVLLASASEAWPDGAGNGSGLVGRNLMFHLNELFAIWPGRGVPSMGPTKALSLRDFYSHDGQRFGTFQAMGVRASYGEIHHYLCQMAAKSGFGSGARMGHLLRLPAAMAARLFGEAQIFVGLLEDMPYAENRVVFDPKTPDVIKVDYRIHDELRARRKAFRRQIFRRTKGLRRLPLGWGPELNLGHPSGTLRFGADPKTSVLNADCRAHDLQNLWVADASFMPTSMGVNPSLTIAANALRVAECMMKA
ncbi:GMC oxidoreductase [Cognatishimia maritima]|uniref:Choline dehydrogenase n=1 Tax=Cognatishimia maritima TaxID=870908 RepID=A0A1M5UUQ4_9RHOB|nr:GMC family oxidoreductase [Cognatishimia maritima]SHH66483.1 Choline dehydrogenase [Cognatishimia maritima]